MHTSLVCCVIMMVNLLHPVYKGAFRSLQHGLIPGFASNYRVRKDRLRGGGSCGFEIWGWCRNLSTLRADTLIQVISSWMMIYDEGDRNHYSEPSSSRRQHPSLLGLIKCVLLSCSNDLWRSVLLLHLKDAVLCRFPKQYHNPHPLAIWLPFPRFAWCNFAVLPLCSRATSLGFI